VERSHETNAACQEQATKKPTAVHGLMLPSPKDKMYSAMGLSESGYVNPCGGVKWRTLSDGRIEVEGQGVPMYNIASDQAELLGLTWSNWTREFSSVSRRYDVPVAWLVAIAFSETGFVAKNKELQRTITSTDGFASVGIMQPLAQTATMYGFTPDDRFDAEKNIEIAARLLVALQRKTSAGFPALAAIYNAGRMCNAGNDQFNLAGYKGKYATTATRALNTAITYMDLRAIAWPLIIGVGIGLTGVAAAAAIALGFVRVR
jgi:hypothetical protein